MTPVYGYVAYGMFFIQYISVGKTHDGAFVTVL